MENQFDILIKVTGFSVFVGALNIGLLLVLISKRDKNLFSSLTSISDGNQIGKSNIFRIMRFVFSSEMNGIIPILIMKISIGVSIPVFVIALVAAIIAA